MSEALYALAGAFLGVVGTVVTEALRSRRDDRTAWRRDLRSACVEFAAEIARLRDLSYALRSDPAEQRLRDAAHDAHTRARGLLERLRLTSDSVATQKAARLLIHHAYHQWQSTLGGPGRPLRGPAGPGPLDGDDAHRGAPRAGPARRPHLQRPRHRPADPRRPEPGPLTGGPGGPGGPGWPGGPSGQASAGAAPITRCTG